MKTKNCGVDWERSTAAAVDLPFSSAISLRWGEEGGRRLEAYEVRWSFNLGVKVRNQPWSG